MTDNLNSSMASPRHFALIPAAGNGSRMGSNRPKQYAMIAGKPMLRHVLDTFASSQSIRHTYVVVSTTDEYIKGMMAEAPHLSERVSVILHGGTTRRTSVLNGLREIRPHATDDDWVLVHDAARPGLTNAMIDRLIDAVHNDSVGGLLAMPIVDTLKRGIDRRVQTTVPREGLWAAQTPQMFRYGLLCRALEHFSHVTDESSAVEALDLHPKLVEGSARNFKVTMPDDIALAEMYLKAGA
ncbi:2-C-methyl-D-erythritol 4-phosphate cytidylyltransferase [soil metagenome]